ncbi:MgtC/SapB family protein [Glycocaulis abyssi]|uniref:Protein MgtC n=1 Tax=Glycocaulis abyssi TaxID=1433403 RepID=A0ABV9NDX9_9PROT
MPEWLNDAGPPGDMLESLMRLGLAALAGAVIGIERERPHRHVGLRTNMLVALAACLFTLLAFQIAISMGDDEAGIQADPVRVIEAVTAGVAFIAAGAIIRAGKDIHGVTTAAALWLSGAVGVAFGAGAFGIGGGAVLLALIVLTVLVSLERHVLGSKAPPARDDDGG